MLNYEVIFKWYYIFFEKFYKMNLFGVQTKSKLATIFYRRLRKREAWFDLKSIGYSLFNRLKNSYCI